MASEAFVTNFIEVVHEKDWLRRSAMQDREEGKPVGNTGYEIVREKYGVDFTPDHVGALSVMAGEHPDAEGLDADKILADRLTHLVGDLTVAYDNDPSRLVRDGTFDQNAEGLGLDVERLARLKESLLIAATTLQRVAQRNIQGHREHEPQINKDRAREELTRLFGEVIQRTHGVAYEYQKPEEVGQTIVEDRGRAFILHQYAPIMPSNE